VKEEISGGAFKVIDKADSAKNNNDRVGERSRGFRFVEMPVQKEAQAVRKELDGIVV
jgi:hypothetical protein